MFRYSLQMHPISKYSKVWFTATLNIINEINWEVKVQTENGYVIWLEIFDGWEIDAPHFIDELMMNFVTIFNIIFHLPLINFVKQTENNALCFNSNSNLVFIVLQLELMNLDFTDI